MIIEKGYFKILDGFGYKGEHIFTAATTCYKSENKTEKTADDFISLMKKNKHLSILEFIWIVFDITYSSRSDLTDDLLLFYKEKYIDVTTNYNKIQVSGNGRAWLEFVEKNPNLIMLDDIKYELNKMSW